MLNKCTGVLMPKMGKEHELLKAVKYNDQQKIQKLLVPETPTFDIKRISKGKSPTSPTVPGGKLRVKLDHININCEEKESGYTSLMLAVLNENKDIIDTLIFHCADVNAADPKGNTALHFAVFSGRVDIVDTLLQNDCQVNKQNSDGNTPLHVACQSDQDRRVMIMLKLLKFSANVFIKNKSNSTPLDVAAMYGKKDAVSVLLDHDSSLSSNSSAIIESALRGYTEVVQLFLDYGVNANCISDMKDTGPLHEATRFLRYESAEKLIQYGASPHLENPKMETPMKIAQSLPESMKCKFVALFNDRSKRESLTPRFRRTDILYSPAKNIKDYPVLPTKSDWTQNSTLYCNSCTAEHPNTNIFDGNLKTFWVIESSQYVWTVINLQTDHTLTGITIYGWNSNQMVKRFELQKGISVHGPWTTVGCFVCKRDGSKDPKENGVPQTFKDFTASSQFWRFHLLENHGARCTCFQGLSLNGCDNHIFNFFKRIDMEDYAENFILQGFNTQRKLLLMSEDAISKIVSNEEHKKFIISNLAKEAQQAFRLKTLKWKRPPPAVFKQAAIFPDIVVAGDPGCRERLKLVLQGVDEKNRSVHLTTETCLETLDENQPSFAVFSSISLEICGKYRCTVQSIDQPDISLQTASEIEIQAKLSAVMQEAFIDMEQMLEDIQNKM